MEPARTDVYRYLLDLIRSRPLAKRDSAESRRDDVRICPPLARELSDTTCSWAAFVAPVAEQTAKLFAGSAGSPIAIASLSTPLTSANRRTAHGTERMRPPRPERPTVAMPACKRCGKPVPTKDRTYCNDCLHVAQRERYAGLTSRQRDVAAGPAEAPRPAVAPRSVAAADSDRVSSRRCKTCGDPVPHRKRVYCDPCFTSFQRELVAMRRPCKRCGQPVPHRKRTLCDACLPATRRAGVADEEGQA